MSTVELRFESATNTPIAIGHTTASTVRTKVGVAFIIPRP